MTKHYRSSYQNAPHTFRTTNDPLYNTSIQQDDNKNEIKTSRRNIPISIEGKLVEQQLEFDRRKSFKDVQQLQNELQRVDQSFGQKNSVLNLPNENTMIKGNRLSVSRRDFDESRASRNMNPSGTISPPSRAQHQKEMEEFKLRVGITEKRRLNDLPKIKFKILCEDED